MEWILKSTKRIVSKSFGQIEKLEDKKLLATTNDPGLSNQWGLTSSSVNQAWNYNTGSKNIVVAVIDSGVDINHIDLKDNIWKNPGEIANNNIDDDNNGFIDDINGWNFSNNSSNIQDGYGHGTHVAGIIGSVGNNQIGAAGINWHISIMPLKFQDDKGIGNTGGAAQAIDYACMMKQKYHINIIAINASWGGGTGFSTTLKNSITNANNNNILFVAAAGNSYANCDIDPRYPACYDIPNIISVAAIDRYNNLASFSNYGANSVDLAAPGVGIYSTKPSNSWTDMSGTSQAAPHVTGAIALLASAKPNMTMAEIKNSILKSVDKLSNLSGRTLSGGKLNVFAAMGEIGIFNKTTDLIQYQEKISGNIGLATTTRVIGWTYSSLAKNRPLTVKVFVNGKVVAQTLANLSRPALLPLFGSINHGFDVILKKQWFHIGTNIVRVDAISPITSKIINIGFKLIKL